MLLLSGPLGWTERGDCAVLPLGAVAQGTRECCGLPPSWLYRRVGWQTQEDPPVVLSTQVHDQCIPVGYGVGIPVEALERYGVEEGMATADVKDPVDGLET